MVHGVAKRNKKHLLTKNIEHLADGAKSESNRNKQIW